MRLPSNLFVNSLTQEYTIEEEPQEKEQDSSPKQKTFEFSFEVGTLQASLSRTDASGTESLLAKAMLKHFTLRLLVDQVRDNRGLIIMVRVSQYGRHLGWPIYYASGAPI